MLNEFQKALTYHEKYLEEDVKNPSTYLQVGHSHRELGRYNDALTMMYQGLMITDENFIDLNALYLAQLSLTYKQMGKYKEAINTCLTAINLCNDSDDHSMELMLLYGCLGGVYNYLGNLEEAISFYRKSLDIDPNNTIVYTDLGHLYLNIKQWSKAIDALNKAVQVNPSNSNPYYHFGILYLIQNQLIDAEYYIKQAIELDTYNGSAVLSLGILQALKGNLEEARISWEKGLKLYGEYAQNDRLFRTLYTIALGEIEQGLTTLKTILTQEKPPVGLLNQVLEIAYLLQRCPQLTGIDEAINMIETSKP